MNNGSNWLTITFRCLQVIVALTIAGAVFIDDNIPTSEVRRTYKAIEPNTYSVQDRLLGNTSGTLITVSCFTKDGDSTFVPEEVKRRCAENLTKFQNRYIGVFLCDKNDQANPEKVKQAFISTQALRDSCSYVTSDSSNSSCATGGTSSWRAFQDLKITCFWYNGLSDADRLEIDNLNSVLVERIDTPLVHQPDTLKVFLGSTLTGLASFALLEALFRLASHIRSRLRKT